MDLAWISLAALLVVILVSCTTAVNPGVLAMVLAWIIGVFIAPWHGIPIGMRGVAAGFPSDLFLTLVGVTLLFTQAANNGTLDRVSQVAVRSCRGNVGMIPIMFFILTFLFSSIGAGNIAGAAFMAPLAMAAAERANISPFLMTIMVAHGSLAGALSPIAPTGIIASNNMAKVGLSGHEMQTYVHNLLANTFVAFAGYFLFGGWKLFLRKENAPPPEPVPAEAPPVADDQESTSLKDPAESAGKTLAPPGPAEPVHHFERRHWITLAVIGVVILAVVFCQVKLGPGTGTVQLGIDRANLTVSYGWQAPLVVEIGAAPLGGDRINIGMAAFVAAILLTLLRLADESEAVRKMPWGVIVMVCGVTVLTELLEKTGGKDRFIDVIEALSTPFTLIPILVFFVAVISVYSSTSGVVLPAFLPMVGDLAARTGVAKMAIASSIIVGGHLVDSSPLSTIGALCVAQAPLTADRRLLFNQVLWWGLSMAVVGALVCWVFFGML